jgi:hypothetical protein
MTCARPSRRARVGAEREAAADEAYQAAFEQVQSDPRSRLIVAEAAGSAGR